MNQKLLLIGLFTMLTGCTKEIHNHYHTKEVVMSQPPSPTISQQPTYTPSASTLQPPSVPQLRGSDKDACDVLYTTYKQCYGLGIQVDDTDVCLNSAGRVSDGIAQRWGDRELGVMLGTVCAVACESANRDMQMPSYAEFATNSCQ